MSIKKQKNGFTLIELLVVISIISLLVAIILPSLGRARELAKRSSCAVTLKGLGSALELYRGDHDCFPRAAQIPSANIPNFDVSMTVFSDDPDNPNDGYVPIWYALEAYASDKKNFLCSADEGPVDPDADAKAKYGSGKYWDVEGTSYEYMMLLGDPHMSEMMLSSGKDSHITTMSCMDHFHGDEGKHHNRNYLFLDGHVGDIVDGDVKIDEQ